MSSVAVLREELSADQVVSTELLQKIDLKGKIPLEMAMSLLPDSSSEFGAPPAPAGVHAHSPGAPQVSSSPSEAPRLGFRSSRPLLSTRSLFVRLWHSRSTLR